MFLKLRLNQPCFLLRKDFVQLYLKNVLTQVILSLESIQEPYFYSDQSRQLNHNTQEITFLCSVKLYNFRSEKCPRKSQGIKQSTYLIRAQIGENKFAKIEHICFPHISNIL